MTNRFYSAIIDYADLRGCWNRQTGKLEVLVSVLACGFKSHFPHQCKGHSIFECPLFLYPTNQQSIISKKATLESHEIFDFVEAELVPQSDKASLRCLCQYWRVGSSPISRTSVKDIRFSSVLYFYIRQISKALSAKKPHWNRTKSLISWKRNLFRSQTRQA